jgi:hypothetical protein
MRWGFRLFAGLALLLPAGAALPADAGLGREETLTLQQRLTDAACYHGAIDGSPSAALDAAIKACPDQRPVLRIETGMHTAQLSGIAVDAQCRLAATGSDDKTVRLWSMPDGKLLRVQRLPIDSGDGGKVAAVAVSPDGRWIAASVDDAHVRVDRKRAIYLFDAITGANVRRVGAIDDSFPIALAFSPDGLRLASATTWGGLRVFDVVTGALLMKDQPFPRNSGYGVAYAPDGTLFGVGENGAITRYDANLKRTAKIKAPHDKQAFSLAIDPSGRRLAVGYADSPMVDLFDAHDLRSLGTPDISGVDNGDLAAIAWSPDRQRLVGAGKFLKRIDGTGVVAVRSWTFDGKFVRDDVIHAGDAVVNLKPCGAAIAFATFDTGFGLLQSDGASVFLRQSRAPLMELKLGGAFAASPDGMRVYFGLGLGAEQPIIFDAASGTLVDSPVPPKDFAIARTAGLPIRNWQFSEAPDFAGKAIKLDQNEPAFSLAIRDDLTGFVLGTRGYVRMFDAHGGQIYQKSGPGGALGLTLARDDSLILVAYADGTVRWLRASDGTELLALFVDVPTRHWVAWTPTGYYMASPGGEALIGWHLNRGWDQLADFFPASRFSARFNRPDIVKLVLKTRDEAEAIRQADETAKRKQDEAPIGAALPPVVTIVSPEMGASFSGDTIEVAVSVRSPSGLAVDRVDALIDGRPVEARGVAPAKSGTARTLTIPVPPRYVEISVVARAGELVSEAARVRLTYSGATPAGEDALKPKLYAVAIGVAEYTDEALRLNYPADDARGFAAALQKQKGGLYSDVEVRTLVDKDATRANVLEALDWLDGAVTSRDIGMVLIAGHGLTDEKGHYWFLPADAAPKRLVATAVSQEDIRREMSAIAGKAMLFLDTCHANRAVAVRGFGPAGVDVASLVNDFAKTENGLITFAASQGAELSQESPAWGHGAFSLALIEGIEGKADLLHKGSITVSALDAYIANRVKDLTEGHQHPVMSRPDTVPDFAFATAR